MRLIAVLALLLATLAIAPAEAADPFGRGAPATERSEPAKAEPGLLAGYWKTMLDIQRQVSRRIARLMREIKTGTNPGAFWLALGFAFAYGAVHTLGPGHGKMITASYFLANEARIAKGFVMGAQVALTHVAAAIVLVWLADVTIRQITGGTPAEITLVRQVSYGTIVLVGLAMLWRAWRKGRRRALHDHDHHHDHDHGHDSSCLACAHQHDGEGGRQGLLALLAGMVPCTGAVLVMLYALANDILYAGIAMVLAISAGMFAAISAIGVASILARRAALSGLSAQGRGRGRLAAVLDYAGALAITTIGAVFLAGTV